MIQPIEVIRIEIEDMPARDAQLYGEKKPSWSTVLCFAGVVALAIGVGLRLCFVLRLFGY